MLRRGVAGAALVDDVPGRRPDDDDVAVTARDERGQQRFGHPRDAEHVDVVHPLPVVEVGRTDGAEPAGAARVVDEDPALRDRGGEGIDGGLVGDVERDRAAADLRGEGLEPVGTPGGGDDLEALGGEPSGGGGPDPAACAGDDGDGACHGVLPSDRWPTPG